MAALNIAFEAPDNFRSDAPSSSRPIDLVHLAKQTMGDKALEIEVLQIFARQARACLAELTRGEACDVKAVAHRLKGAAAAVGAQDVANAAARLEAAPADSALIAAAGSAIINAENFILKLCR
jgi:HPt (histidine-containing phosphotransfer) domain-containing protein